MADEEEKLLQEARKLPWEDRLAHKNWKCRNDAYISIAEVCNNISDPKDPRLHSFGQYFKKAVSDSNAPAQEKALDALIAFLKAGDSDIGRYAKEVCDATAAKCLTGRTKTVEKAIVSFLLWVELEAVDSFMDSMDKAVKNKVAKAVVPAVEAIYESLRGFGIKIIPPKRVMKLLPDLFTHADEKVRAMAKALTVELTRWIGKESVKKLLIQGLREATQRELEAELEKVDERAVPTRKLRSEMDQEIEPEIEQDNSASVEAEETEIGETEIDEYELCEPVDILVPLGKTNFWAGIEEKKWSERKEAVAELTQLASKRRIAPGEFVPVARALKKLVTDVNIVVSVEAIQAAGNLANGLRKDFSGGSQLMLPVLLEKFKEKKPAVIAALRDTLRNMFRGGCFSLTDMLEDVKVSAKNKVPSTRSETLLWVAECIEYSKAPELLKVHKDYVPILMESLLDTTPEVRDAAFSALANLATIVGMRPLERSLDKLDDVRKKKLTEMIASSNPTPIATSAPKLAANGGTANRGNGNASSAGIAASAQPGAARNAAASFLSNKRPVLRPVQPGTSKASTNSTKGGGKGKNEGKKPNAAAAEEQEDVEPGEMTPEAIEEKAKSLNFPPEIFTNLKSNIWKERLEGITALKECLEVWAPEYNSNVEVIIRLVSLIPGWSEKNVQVLQKVIEICSLVSTSATKFPKKCVVLCINGVVEKVGDIKTRLQAGACLTSFAEAVGPQFIFERSYTILKNTKNPKVLAESVTWMGQAVAEFGVSLLKLKDLIDFCKDVGLASSTAACRTATIKLLGTLHKFTGPDLKAFLGDLKPALMAPIEAEFEKNPFEGAPPPPTRAVKSTEENTAASVVVGGDGLPREDISGKLSSALLENLSSSQWKVRQESLEAINAIVEEANGRIQPTGTGELFSGLKGRLSDTNKNLIVLTMATLASLCTAMGPGVDKASRNILSDVLKCLSDPKKQMREAVLKTLDAWVAVVPMEKIVPSIAAEFVSPKMSGDGRKDLLDWLAANLSEAMESNEVSLLVKVSSAGLQEKSAEVRKSSEALLVTVIKVSGFDQVFKSCRSTLSSQGFAVIGPVLDRQKSGSTLSGSEGHEDSGSSSSSRASNGQKPLSTQGMRNGVANGVARTSLSKSRGGMVRSSTTAPKSTKQSSLDIVDSAVHGQPLFMLRESIKEEREKGIPRGVKMKFEPPGPQHVVELEEDMKKFFREDLALRLCSKDFKLQVDGLEMLRKAIPEYIRDMEEILDLLLRWSVLRLCETNTTGLLKVLDFLPDLFHALKEDNYMLTESEANIFLPCLVEKSGHNFANVKEKMRDLLRLLCNVCPSSKVFGYVVDGIRSKNNRTRVECVDHIGAMIDRFGVGIMGGSKVPLVSVAALTTERDAEIRKAALNTLSIAYKILGDDIWKQVGKLSDAQKGLLEDKFRWKAREMEKKKEGRPGDGKATDLRKSREEPPTLGLPTAGSVADSPSPHSRLSSNPTNGFKSPLTPLPPPAAIPLQVEILSPQTWTEAVDFIGSLENIEQAVEGMKVVCHELTRVMEEGDSPALEDYVGDADRLAAMLTLQVSNAFQLSMLPGQSSRPCKYVLNTLMQVFQIPSLSHAVSESQLKSLVSELLLWLLDERVPLSTEDGHNLLKALNVLMLKILDNAWPTSAFVVLISLLRPADPRIGPSPVASMSTAEHAGSRGSKFSDLVVRCLIKLTKGLSLHIEDVDLDRLVLSIHEYLQELGLDEIRKRAGGDDKPLRMVKTVLHEACKLVGPAIKAHLSLVPIDAEPPPIVLAYIDLNLQTLAATRLATPVRADRWQQRDDGEDEDEASHNSGSHMNDALRRELRLIFKKIGNKSTSAAGLYELWTITQLHPEVDIFACLTSTSEEMQHYIRDGLDQVQRTVAAGGSAGNVMAATPPPLVPSAAAVQDSPVPTEQEAPQKGRAPHGEVESPGYGPAAAAEFKQKMAHMQALGATYSSNSVATATAPSSSVASGLNMELLRERMRKIQQLGADVGAN